MPMLSIFYFSIFNTSTGQKMHSGTFREQSSSCCLRGRASGATPAAQRAAWALKAPGPGVWQVKRSQVCPGLVSLLRWAQRSPCVRVRGPGSGGKEQGHVASAVLFLLFHSLLCGPPRLRRRWGALKGLWLWLGC